MLKEKTENFAKDCNELLEFAIGQTMNMSDIEHLDSDTFNAFQKVIKVYREFMDLAVAQAGLLDEMNKKLDAVNQKLSN